MTNEIVPQPDPAAVERVLRQNLAEYAFHKTLIMEPARQLLFQEDDPEVGMYFEQPGSLDEYFYEQAMHNFIMQQLLFIIICFKTAFYIKQS